MTVIVPTIGRRSLVRTLASIVAQPRASRLEVLVVGDTHKGPLPEAEAAARRFGARYLEHSTGVCSWGHAQRQAAMAAARGRWLVSLDDDDVWTPDALASIAGATAAGEDLLIFRMRYAADGRVLWDRRRIEEGNVGTPMMVVPNRPELLGTWGDRYQGDFDFLRSTVGRWPGGEAAVRWLPDVIAEIRPST